MTGQPGPRGRGGQSGRGRLRLAITGVNLRFTMFLYNLSLLVLLPLVATWLIWRAGVRRKGAGSWRHRLGLVPRAPRADRPRIWLHAVSAGEVAAVKPVLEALRAKLPQAFLAVSTITPAGMTVARRTCQAADALFYLPWEFLPCMGAALARLRPHLLVVVEKELWPNLLGLARLAGASTLVVNGRLSDRMMRRARWAGPAVRWLCSLPDRFCVQSAQDARRLAELHVGPDRITVSGNTKVDSTALRDEEAEDRLRQVLAVSDEDRWLVAGSTHAGEEEQVVEAFLQARSELPGARLLLAPRHLDRVASVSAMVAERGLSVVRRSDGAVADRNAVVVLDTMGELRAAYACATVSFVGGTLVPIGGHNLLEPVAAGKAVLFGPHTQNCDDVAELVLQAEVGFRVHEAGDLARQFVRIGRDQDLQQQVSLRAQALIAQQRGAAQRCADEACALLGGSPC